MNRILVYDGPDDKSSIIGEAFGSPNHKFVKSISSSGKSMFIHLQKEWESTVVEFAASIKYNKINSACQSWLEGNVLMTQSHPNHNCSWLITRKFGSYITLDFTFIEVKPMSIANNILISICMNQNF